MLSSTVATTIAVVRKIRQRSHWLDLSPHALCLRAKVAACTVLSRIGLRSKRACLSGCAAPRLGLTCCAAWPLALGSMHRIPPLHYCTRMLASTSALGCGSGSGSSPIAEDERGVAAGNVFENYCGQLQARERGGSGAIHVKSKDTTLPQPPSGRFPEYSNVTLLCVSSA